MLPRLHSILWHGRAIVVCVKTLNKYSCCFLKALLSSIFKRENSHTQKEKPQATSRPSDVLHHCSGTKLSLGLKTCLDAPLFSPQESFQSPRVLHRQPNASKNTGWVMFVPAISATQLITVVSAEGSLRTAAASAHGAGKLISHIQLSHQLPSWPWTHQPYFAPAQKWKLQALPLFSPSLFGLSMRVQNVKKPAFLQDHNNSVLQRMRKKGLKTWRHCLLLAALLTDDSSSHKDTLSCCNIPLQSEGEHHIWQSLRICVCCLYKFTNISH